MHSAEVYPAIGGTRVNLLDLAVIERFYLSVNEYLIFLCSANICDREHHSLGVRISCKKYSILFLDFSHMSIGLHRGFNSDWFVIKNSREISSFNRISEFIDASRIFIGHNNVLKKCENCIQIRKDKILIPDDS